MVTVKRSSGWLSILGLLAACAGGDPAHWSEAADDEDDAAELEAGEGEDGEAIWGTAEQALCADLTGVAGFPGDPPRCDDVGNNAIIEAYEDGREDLGTFTGNGQCLAFEHRNFRGASLALDRNVTFTFVGSKMNDEISSFRVASGCQIISFRDRDQRGRQVVFSSDAAYVGDDTNDAISSYECRCR